MIPWGSYLNSACDSRSERDSSHKLCDDRKYTSLGHCEGPRSHRGGVTVGDIVGAVSSRCKDKCNSSDRKDPIERRSVRRDRHLAEQVAVPAREMEN